MTCNVDSPAAGWCVAVLAASVAHPTASRGQQQTAALVAVEEERNEKEEDRQIRGES